jgi:hypothetical protein
MFRASLCMMVTQARLLAVIAAASLSMSPAPRVIAARASTQSLPPLVLWAWERPADLRGLPTGTGVALLTQTIRLDARTFAVSPRRQPLRVDRSTPLIAVTRVETSDGGITRIDNTTLARIAERIAATAALPQVVAVQIDFDATASERTSYRRLLAAVRAQLPQEMPLSMTALASWCAGDRWLDGLPVDEAVPMLFQMGAADQAYAGIAGSRRSAAPACREALGVALEEPMAVRADRRRVYVFNADAWTPASVALAQEIGR